MRRSCLFFLLLLSGCGLLGTPEPAPAPPAGVLAPGDTVRITVADAPEMSGAFSVTQDGNVHLDLLGAVKAAGLTPAMLADSLRQRLAAGYLKEPQVMVVRAVAPAVAAGEPAAPVTPVTSRPMLVGSLPAEKPAATSAPPPLEGSLAEPPANGFSPPAPVLRPSQDVGQKY